MLPASLLLPRMIRFSTPTLHLTMECLQTLVRSTDRATHNLGKRTGEIAEVQLEKVNGPCHRLSLLPLPKNFQQLPVLPGAGTVKILQSTRQDIKREIPGLQPTTTLRARGWI